MSAFSRAFNAFADHVHAVNRRFWCDLDTGKGIEDTPELLASKIALMHSELSEMLEGVRKGGKDKHLPYRLAEEVELADLIIRAFDYAGRRRFDIGGAITEKMDYNATRQDHTDAARRAAGGKKL